MTEIKLTFPESVSAKLMDGELVLELAKPTIVLGKGINNVQLTKNFNLSEFESDNNVVKVSTELVLGLQIMRNLIGRPIKVINGYRTPEHNKRVGGADNSQHLHGRAADITVEGMSGKELAKFAEVAGFNAIGIAKTAIHVDDRPERVRWNY